MGWVFRALCSAALLAVTGCATERTVAPPLDGLGEAIVYETDSGPFCGRCDSTQLILASDGRIWVEHGYWAGDYRNWRVRRRLVRSTPEAFARFRDRMSPFRPTGVLWLREPGPDCATFLTDGSEVRLRWLGDGADAELWFAYGCDPIRHAALHDAVAEAVAELGLGELPGVEPSPSPDRRIAERRAVTGD